MENQISHICKIGASGTKILLYTTIFITVKVHHLRVAGVMQMRNM